LSQRESLRPEDVQGIQERIWPDGQIHPTVDSDEDSDIGNINDGQEYTADAGEVAEELDEDGCGDEGLSEEDEPGVLLADHIRERLLAEACKHGA
jgi:hypothetical protein